MKKGLICSSQIALLVAIALGGGSAFAEQVTLGEANNNGNPYKVVLEKDVISNTTASAVWAKGNTNNSGFGTGFTTNGHQVTANNLTDDATAFNLNGASGETKLTATGSVITATSQTSKATALSIRETNKATITGGTFIANSNTDDKTIGFAHAVDLSNTGLNGNKNFDITLDGVHLSAESKAPLLNNHNAAAIYIGKSNATFTDTITIKNKSSIEKGDILFEGSSATGSVTHTYNLNIQDSSLGTEATNSIVVTAHHDSATNSAYQGVAHSTVNVNVTGTSDLNTDVMAWTQNQANSAQASEATINLQLGDTAGTSNVTWSGKASTVETVGKTGTAKVNITSNKNSSWTNKGESNITSLTFNGGSVDISGGSIETDALTTLKDSTSTIKFDPSSKNHLKVNQTLTDNGSIVLQSTGNWSQDVNSNNAIIDTDNKKLNASLQGGSLDAGLNRYGLTENNGDYKLQRIGESSSSVVIQSLAAAPVDIANLQRVSVIDHINATRLSSNYGSGVWTQYLGSKIKRTTAADTTYNVHTNGIIVGADTRVAVDNGSWIAGAAVSYAKGDVSALSSSADVDGYSLHVYGVRQFDNGFYVNGAALIGRWNSDADIVLSQGGTHSGSYNSTGYGLEVGAGYTWQQTNGLFVEPYVQLSYLSVGSADYQIDNAKVHTDNYKSLLGEIGTRFGSEIKTANGSVRPYLQLSLLNEFASGNDVALNGVSTDASIDGAAWRIGAGVQADFSKNVTGYLGLHYTKGDNYEAPVQGFVGVNIKW